MLHESVVTTQGHKGTVLVIMMVLCALQTAAERESFTVPPPTCPSETVTFTCTVNDSNYHNTGRLGTTYWQVGPDNDYRPCDLPHPDPEIVRVCGPNDAFEARSQPPHGGYYTSALQVTAHPSLNGTRVRCYVFDEQGQKRTVGRGRLKVIGAPRAPSFLQPNESDIVVLEGSVNVTVRWSEPQDYRHTANITSYNITANCTMPSQGISWVDTLTVQDSQKMMSFPVGIVGTLTVHADVCDSLVGNDSKALEFCTEVPPPVPNCSTTAVYNGSSDDLTNIVVNWYKTEVPCHQNLVAPGLSSNVTSYTVSVNKQTVEQEYVCVSDSEQCSYAWNDADHNAVNYTVSVAANNVVGQGVIKNCTTTPIDRRNNMLSVSVHVDSHNNLSISCTFLSSFHGVLHCEIWHSNADSTLAHLKFSTVSQQRASAGDSVLIDSITLDASTVYIYNVSAVPDGESTPAVVVQGVITTPPTTTRSPSEIHGNSTTVDPQSSHSPWGIIFGVILPVAVVSIVIILCLCKFHYHKRIKDICCRWSVGGTDEIDIEKNGRMEADGSESSANDDHEEHDGDMKGGSYRLYNRSHSAPSERRDIDPFQSLPLNATNENDVDPSRSLPLNILSRLGKGNRYTLLSDDQHEKDS